MCEYIILEGGNTDTNAAVSGALLGIHLGEEKLKSDEIFKKNLEKVIESDTSSSDYPRDKKYHPKDYASLSKSLFDLLKENC